MTLKKLFTGLISLAAALLAGIAVSVSAGAATSGDFEYKALTDGTVEITKYAGNAAKLTVPASIGGKKVTSIGEGAFYNCTSLTSLTIPNGVTSIGTGAFARCVSIASINLPESLTNIGPSAFEYCTNLVSITIPNNVTSIGYSAFYQCHGLTSVKLSDNLKFVDHAAFAYCTKLTSITIPDGVTGIGQGSFACCEKLTSVKIPDSVTSIEYCAFQLCINLPSVTIPDSVTSIGGCAFDRCLNLKNVYYTGSKAKWGKIDIDADNEELASVTIHYDYKKPSAVSGLKLKGRAGDALRIAWSKNTSADGYIIEMKSGTKWVRVGKITKNSTVEFRKDKLKAGTSYSFRVKAYKMSGKTALYSGYKTISARTNPSAVSGLKLKGRSGDALRIAWAKNTSADGYIIEMKSGTKWVRVGKITKNTTVEFRKAGLKAGTAYSFRVKAYKMSGKTALYSGYTTISARTNPSAVSGLKLKNANSTAVRIAWAKNTSADGYIIEMKVNGVWKRAGKITKNSTVEFKKSKLMSKTSYTFRIKAYKMSGKTALYSGYKTITVKTK